MDGRATTPVHTVRADVCERAGGAGKQDETR
jgi:hypothetical protein